MNNLYGELLTIKFTEKYLHIAGIYSDSYIFNIESINSVSYFRNLKKSDSELDLILGINVQTSNKITSINLFNEFYDSGIQIHEDKDESLARRNIKSDIELLFKILNKEINN